jgi:reverse gyrase
MTFARYFFEHLLGRSFGRMHRDLIRLYERSRHEGELADRPARRLAIAAPRGAAKTTLKSLILPIHATLYGRERYIAILSATLKQARRRLANILAEIDTNAYLKSAFPSELARRGSCTTSSIHVNDVQIDIFSAGTELRGISHRQWRPTLVLLDDIEDSEAV